MRGKSETLVLLPCFSSALEAAHLHTSFCSSLPLPTQVRDLPPLGDITSPQFFAVGFQVFSFDTWSLSLTIWTPHSCPLPPFQKPLPLNRESATLPDFSHLQAGCPMSSDGPLFFHSCSLLSQLLADLCDLLSQDGLHLPPFLSHADHTPISSCW